MKRSRVGRRAEISAESEVECEVRRRMYADEAAQLARRQVMDDELDVWVAQAAVDLELDD